MFKQIDTTQLYLEVVRPTEEFVATDSKPAIIFFFGGGWKNGNRHHFLPQAGYFAQRGIVCFLADYRTESKHGTTPFDCLEDAKSAMRYVRQNASSLGVDPDRLVAAGGSAGGHLAAATALVSGYESPTEDQSISTLPNALMLFNPVIDNGPAGYGYDRVQNQYHSFSPLHNIQDGAPPTLFLLGTDDNLIPVETGKYFEAAMKRVGSKCTLVLYEDGKHGFFNYRNFDFYKQTVQEADAFLQSLGYLKGKSTVPIE